MSSNAYHSFYPALANPRAGPCVNRYDRQSILPSTSMSDPAIPMVLPPVGGTNTSCTRKDGDEENTPTSDQPEVGETELAEEDWRSMLWNIIAKCPGMTATFDHIVAAFCEELHEADNGRRLLVKDYRPTGNQPNPPDLSTPLTTFTRCESSYLPHKYESQMRGAE